MTEKFISGVLNISLKATIDWMPDDLCLRHIMSSSISEHELLDARDTKMSLVTRKPVFGLCDQLRLKLACSADETS